jgi:hypothetical protein
MKATLAILISSVGVLLGWVGKAATMGRMDAEEFRLVKDGKVLWSVEPSRGGAIMTFFVDGKPMIELGADSNASALNINAIGSSEQCNIVVKEGVVSWGMGAPGAAQIVDRMEKKEGAWTVLRHAQVREHSAWWKGAEIDIDEGFSRGFEMGMKSGGGRHPYVVKTVGDDIEAHGIGGGGVWRALATKKGRLALEVIIAEKGKALWEYWIK